MFLLRPHTEASLKVGIWALPIVLVFVLLFNLYSSGKFGKTKPYLANSKLYLIIIALFIILTSAFLSKFL